MVKLGKLDRKRLDKIKLGKIDTKRVNELDVKKIDTYILKKIVLKDNEGSEGCKGEHKK